MRLSLNRVWTREKPRADSAHLAWLRWLTLLAFPNCRTFHIVSVGRDSYKNHLRQPEGWMYPPLLPTGLRTENENCQLSLPLGSKEIDPWSSSALVNQKRHPLDPDTADKRGTDLDRASAITIPAFSIQKAISVEYLFKMVFWMELDQLSNGTDSTEPFRLRHVPAVALSECIPIWKWWGILNVGYGMPCWGLKGLILPTSMWGSSLPPNKRGP